MAVLTLNQIVNRIRTLASSHNQLRSFYFGDVPEFDANGEIVYAACFLEQLPGSIDRTEHLQRFIFRMYLLDLVPESTKSEENETEVLSDMASVAADMVAMLMDSATQFDWLIKEVMSVTPVTEGLQDLVAGVYVDIEVAVDFLADRCQIPADDVTFEEDFDMARTRLLTYTATGNEGDSFIVPDLSGKNVLAAYRAGFYKRVIQTVPTDTENVGVVGTDLGTRKGTLASSGTVKLSLGDALVPGEILDLIIWE